MSNPRQAGSMPCLRPGKRSRGKSLRAKSHPGMDSQHRTHFHMVGQFPEGLRDFTEERESTGS